MRTYKRLLAWCGGEQRGGGLPGLGAGHQAEVGEFRLQQAQGAADGLGAARCGLQPHDPHVQVLVVGVVGKGRLQRGQRLVRVGRLEDLRGGGPGVQGAAPRGLGIRLGPLVAGALGQLAPVQGDRAAAVRRSPAMTVPPSGQQVLARMARLCTAAPTECQRPGAAHIGGYVRASTMDRSHTK